MSYKEIIKEQYWSAYESGKIESIRIKDLFKESYINKRKQLGMNEYGLEDLDPAKIKFKRCDFESIDFKNDRLRAITSWYLYMCKFHGCELSSLNFHNAYIECCEFSETDMKHIDPQKIRNNSFLGCMFDACDFSGVDFTNVVLRDCTFKNIEKIGFSGEVIDLQSLENCTFENCNLNAIDFRTVNVRKASFINCDLSKSNIHKALRISMDNFVNCKLPLALLLKTPC